MKHFSVVFIEGLSTFLMQRKGWVPWRHCYRIQSQRCNCGFDLSEAAKQWKTLGSIAYVPQWVCMEIGVVGKDAQATV